MTRYFSRLWLRLKFGIKNSYYVSSADTLLVGAVCVVVAFGLMMLSSATAVVSYANGRGSYAMLKEQLIFVLLGVALATFLSRFNYRWFKEHGFTFLVISVISLLLVFIPGVGVSRNGATSWISFLGQEFQPSELVKLFFLFYLSAWLASKKNIIKQTHEGTMPFLITLATIAGLMILQKDVGTFLIIAGTALTVYFIGGGNVKHIAVIMIAGLMALTIIVQSNQHQKDRFRCYLNPSSDPLKSCYQIDQSMIAVGSGGFWGRGLGQSRQKLFYLPEVSNDFIFAVIGEEVGMFGSLAVILAFLFIFYRGYVISQNVDDDFGKYLALGISSWIMIQAIVNIGGVVNFIPMTGVPLPFISKGGTAVVSSLAAMGILINISRSSSNRYER